MFASLLDLVLPRVCIGCWGEDGPICSACLPAVEPQVVTIGELIVRAAAPYEATLRAALIAYKEHGRRDLARPLGRLLAAALPAGAALVPVPSRRGVARRRGGDHVLRLCRRTGRPIVVALRLTRDVADSTGLSAPDRQRNLRGAMAAAPPAPGQENVVIVDDIVTSGATLTEAARTLRAAGWRPIGAATVAWTPRQARA